MQNPCATQHQDSSRQEWLGLLLSQGVFFILQFPEIKKNTVIHILLIIVQLSVTKQSGSNDTQGVLWICGWHMLWLDHPRIYIIADPRSFSGQCAYAGVLVMEGSTLEDLSVTEESVEKSILLYFTCQDMDICLCDYE